MAACWETAGVCSAVAAKCERPCRMAELVPPWWLWQASLQNLTWVSQLIWLSLMAPGAGLSIVAYCLIQYLCLARVEFRVICTKTWFSYHAVVHSRKIASSSVSPHSSHRHSFLNGLVSLPHHFIPALNSPSHPLHDNFVQQFPSDHTIVSFTFIIHRAFVFVPS